LIKNNIFAAIISNSSDSNRQNLKNINKLERGGLSGKPIEKKSNDLISKFYKYLKDKVIIIGVGGVDSGKSVYEKITNGASLVQLYTGMIYKGPNIVSKISEDLNDILKKDGIKNISEVVGIKK
jgi:Dihydroorotate dehydrogenase